MTASFGVPVKNKVSVAGSSKESVEKKMGVLAQNFQDDSGFSQWITAMKMVVQLPGGIPADFRSRLWLSLADRYLAKQGIHWKQVEKHCFNDVPQPEDAVLESQIAKDLHRTGCNLFCGEAGKENQVLLKKVLIAYARWNKNVGYCQGFNMLAALILQVTNKCEEDALKVMIYLVEGVLPDSYFANNLRGLSVDMAVFRDLMHLKLPKLSRHLERLQISTKDGIKSYEPPLTNVFTIQWFLTLFCNCLPQTTVLRIWDLIFLEGNEILLKTALCIWKILSDKIMEVQSADEFYGTMADLTKRLLSSNFLSPNALIRAIVTIGPLTGLDNLRRQYLYSISQKCHPAERKAIPKHTIPLDISVLKKQYSKIKQRQKQAHVIFFSALSKQQQPSPEVINHLMVRKPNSHPANQRSMTQGISRKVPIQQIVRTKETNSKTPTDTIYWRDESKENCSSSSSSTDTELCDDEDRELSENEVEPVKLTNDICNETNDNRSASNIVQSIDSNYLNDSINNLTPSEIKIDALPEDLINLEHHLKEESEDSVMETIFSSRRNSLSALKIMQENSMILHRIMNCQNRTPSPPSISENIDFSNLNTCGSLPNLEEIETVPTLSGCENLYLDENFYVSDVLPNSSTSFSPINEDFLLDTVIHPDILLPYKNRSLLFEKSLSLDEKYKDLILNKNACFVEPQSPIHESKSKGFLPHQIFCDKGRSKVEESPATTNSLSTEKLSCDLVCDFKDNLHLSSPGSLKEENFQGCTLEANEESGLFSNKQFVQENKTFNCKEHPIEHKNEDSVVSTEGTYVNNMNPETTEQNTLDSDYQKETISKVLEENSSCDPQYTVNIDRLNFLPKVTSPKNHEQSFLVSNSPSDSNEIDAKCDFKQNVDIPKDIHVSLQKVPLQDDSPPTTGQAVFFGDNQKVIEKTSRELIEENVRVLESLLNRKKAA